MHALNERNYSLFEQISLLLDVNVNCVTKSAFAVAARCRRLKFANPITCKIYLSAASLTFEESTANR